jgi:hypothetical protein
MSAEQGLEVEMRRSEEGLVVTEGAIGGVELEWGCCGSWYRGGCNLLEIVEEGRWRLVAVVGSSYRGWQKGRYMSG